MEKKENTNLCLEYGKLMALFLDKEVEERNRRMKEKNDDRKLRRMKY
mgnify:CR=1 FL=1